MAAVRSSAWWYFLNFLFQIKSWDKNVLIFRLDKVKCWWRNNWWLILGSLLFKSCWFGVLQHPKSPGTKDKTRPAVNCSTPPLLEKPQYPTLSEERRPERVLEELDCKYTIEEEERIPQDPDKKDEDAYCLAHIANVMSCVMLTLMTLQFVKTFITCK